VIADGVAVGLEHRRTGRPLLGVLGEEREHGLKHQGAAALVGRGVVQRRRHV
jgi:hypothetical protein